MLSLLGENIRIAFQAIKSQLLRTILTVLIIAIGITALVAILSLVQALGNTITSDFSSMGANTFNIQQYEFTTQRRGSGETQKINPVISYRQVKEFKENYNYPGSQVSIAFTGAGSAEVKYEGKETDPEVTVMGVNENFLDNSGLNLDGGRNFNLFDIQNNNMVCVLGSDFKKNLFKNVDPIGKTINIRGNRFKVIGILEEKGSTFGNNQDLRVLIPIEVARGVYTQPNINYQVSIKINDKNMLEGAQDEAIIAFRKIRGLSPTQENNFGIMRSDDLLNQVAEITGVLGLVAWIISGITIMGSSIALMNIMLVSVTERTREIGVRKALGARKGLIAGQFLIETIIVGQLGGILGIILGMSIGLLISSLASFDFSIPWFAMIAATLITLVVAIVSGLFPALKAARLDPVESLRYE